MSASSPLPPRSRLGQQLIIALIAWVVLWIAFIPFFPRHGWMYALAAAGIPVALVFAKVRQPRGAARYQIKGHPPFNPAFGADTIALDTQHQTLWVRDIRGNRYIFDRAQIAEWTHHWSISRNAWGHSFHRENRLEIRTRSLDTPTVIIAFRRYRDWTGSNKNYRAAVEWKDRLSVFVNG